MQLRPCFLVVDTEHAGSISTRKLVLETAKYNVITAYSCMEAIAVLERFARVHGVVIDSAMRDGHVGDFWCALARLPEVKLIVVGENPNGIGTRRPDAVVQSFAPARLLESLATLFPEQARFLEKREQFLEAIND